MFAAGAHDYSIPVYRLKYFLSICSVFVSRFQVVCEKPFLAKYQKGTKLLASWDSLAATISNIPDFAFSGGVTGRGCGVEYKEMMEAHRDEVKSGEFTSGVREGMDDATQPSSEHVHAT